MHHPFASHIAPGAAQPPAALHADDFALSAQQLQAINAYVQDRYRQFVAQGSVGRFPEVQVRLEFAPRYGRSVYVSLGLETTEVEIERWSQLRTNQHDLLQKA